MLRTLDLDTAGLVGDGLAHPYGQHPIAECRVHFLGIDLTGQRHHVLEFAEAESQIASIVAEGLTNAQVAERLFLSRHTVDFQLRKIFRKLGIRSRVELTRLVLEHGSNDGVS